MTHRSLTATAVAAIAASSALLPAATASATQPALVCTEFGLSCETNTHRDGLRASYADSVPGEWKTPTVTLADDPADALNVEPGSWVSREYTITIDSGLGGDPNAVYFLIEDTGQRWDRDSSVHRMQYYLASPAPGLTGNGPQCDGPDAENLLPGQSAIISCLPSKDRPEGDIGPALVAIDDARDDFRNLGEKQSVWKLDSQPRPAEVTATAPKKAPDVTVDGQDVTAESWDTTWTTTVQVTTQAPDTAHAETTYTPKILVNGSTVDAPSFRITTGDVPAKGEDSRLPIPPN